MDRIKAKLQPVEVLLRKLSSRCIDVISLWNIDLSQIFYLNPAFEQLYGTPALLVYQDPSRFWQQVHPEDKNILTSFEQYAQSIAKDSSLAFEQNYRILRLDSSVRYIKETRIPLYDEYNQCIAIGILIDDMTAVRQWQSVWQEGLTKKDSTLVQYNDFWRNNHQLLQAHYYEITRRIEQFAEHCLTLEQREELSRINNHIQQVTVLASDMGQAYLNEFPPKQSEGQLIYNLHEAVESIHDFFTETCALQGKRFVVNVDAKLRQDFLGEIEIIKQALRCLVLLLLQDDKAKVILLQARELECSQHTAVVHLSLSGMGGIDDTAEFYPNAVKAHDPSMHPFYKIAQELFKQAGGSLETSIKEQYGIQLGVTLECVYAKTAEIYANQCKNSIPMDDLTYADIPPTHILNTKAQQGPFGYAPLQMMAASTVLSSHHQIAPPQASAPTLQAASPHLRAHVLQYTEQEAPSAPVGIQEATAPAHYVNMPVRKKSQPTAHALVIEDNLINQHVVSLILKEIGCTADIASNGQEALKLWDNDYDFVFLDIGLPGMDGFELAHKLRLKQKQRHIPIIGMSAHLCVSEHDRDSLGPLDDFLNKPFGLANVNALVKKWVIEKHERETVD